jgi:ATP-dependent RNA helicase DDX23/PRP28
VQTKKKNEKKEKRKREYEDVLENGRDTKRRRDEEDVRKKEVSKSDSESADADNHNNDKEKSARLSPVGQLFDADLTDNIKSNVEPVSLEELLKKKQEKDEEESRPVFLTKQQRRELALKKREAEVALIRQRQEEQRKQREKFLQQLRDENRHDDRRDSRDREREERERDEARRKRLEEREQDKEERDKDKEKELIKLMYLGKKKEKRKIIKVNDKSRFVFDWDAADDTSQTLNIPGVTDTNPVYQCKVEVRPQFGRGFFAGIDPKEQLRRYKEVSEIHEKMKAKAKETEEIVDRMIAKKLEKLEKTEKPDKHWSEKTLEEMTPRDWRIFKEDFNIATKGGGIPNPIRSWDESGLPKWILDAVRDAQYAKPTPIQMQAIPIGLQKRDILGVAETGSGKTAAFVLPMLVHISQLGPASEADGPHAIILVPTRELANQIDAETQKFAKYTNIRTVCLIGGVSIDEQGMALRRGCEVVIATPGRLVDCLESRHIVLSQCKYVVLDEADRMIDMGFEDKLLKILDAMPKASQKSENEEEAERQEKDRTNMYRTTIMFSATMPPAVENLARKYLRRPAIIYIGEVGRAVDKIKQNVEWMKSEFDKRTRLEELLTTGPPPPIIVFVNQKKACDVLAKYISKLGFKATTLHSGKSQEQREWALEEFRQGRFDVLVATDVAARGLDVKGVTHVINYDMPKNIEAYTHRIGRTGRAGEAGLATSFLTADDTDIMYDLKQMLQKTNNYVPQELREHPAAQYKPGTVPPTKRETIIYTN